MSARIEKGYVYVLTNDCLKEVDWGATGSDMVATVDYHSSGGGMAFEEHGRVV